MISCKTLEQAETIAKEISAKELRSISIVKRYRGSNFIVCDNYKNGIEDRKCHDKFILLVTNYKAPFGVYSVSPKSGEHWEYYPTEQQRDDRYKELVKDRYRKDIRKFIEPVN